MFDDLDDLAYEFKDIYNKHNLFDNTHIKNLGADCGNSEVD